MMAPASALDRARAAWGDAPDWIVTLAEACDRSSQRQVAEEIGYSAATISNVLKATYKGDLTAVEKAVRGALMRLTVDCPVLGEIPANQCLIEQRRPFAATNARRVALYRACRGLGGQRCPHSRVHKGGNGDA